MVQFHKLMGSLNLASHTKLDRGNNSQKHLTLLWDSKTDLDSCYKIFINLSISEAAILNL